MPTYYAQTIFAKPLDQITEADLTSYFQQERDETLNLEFKSHTDKPGDTRGQAAKDADKTKGVLKTISAFLNSSGGLLIWGAPESVEVKRGEKKVKMCRGPLAPVPKYYDRDDFINKIAGQISPVPAGVRMQPVQVAGGNYVYLFDVPESQNKPHQNDGRYYVRMDTRTDAAPHYLVYALCHQTRTPTLKLGVWAGSRGRGFADKRSETKADVGLIISNETAFVHDENIYVVIQSPTLFFRTEQSNYQHRIHRQDVARLLPYGLPVTITVHVEFPGGSETTEHTIDIWYGGSRSNVTRATYSLTCGPASQSQQNLSYPIQIELIKEVGLDRTEEAELSFSNNEG